MVIFTIDCIANISVQYYYIVKEKNIRFNKFHVYGQKLMMFYIMKSKTEFSI